MSNAIANREGELAKCGLEKYSATTCIASNKCEESTTPNVCNFKCEMMEVACKLNVIEQAKRIDGISITNTTDYKKLYDLCSAVSPDECKVATFGTNSECNNFQESCKDEILILALRNGVSIDTASQTPIYLVVIGIILILILVGAYFYFSKTKSRFGNLGGFDYY